MLIFFFAYVYQTLFAKKKKKLNYIQVMPQAVTTFPPIFSCSTGKFCLNFMIANAIACNEIDKDNSPRDQEIGTRCHISAATFQMLKRIFAAYSSLNWL